MNWNKSDNLDIVSGQGTNALIIVHNNSFATSTDSWVQATYSNDCGYETFVQTPLWIRTTPRANNISMRSVGSYQLYTDRWTNITGYYNGLNDGLSRGSLFWEWQVSNSSYRHTEGEFYINVKPNVNFDTQIYIAARVCNECGCSSWTGDWFDVRYRSSSGGGGRIIEY